MKNTIIRIVTLIMLIGTFSIIFGFSNQDGEKSGGISKQVTIKIIEILPTTNNKTETEKTQLIEKIHPIIRKLAHFSIYTLVGILFMTHMNTYNIKKKKMYIVSIVGGTLYAILDEIHQSYIPGRGPSIKDVGIDALGVIFGVLIVTFVIMSIKKYKNRQLQKM